MMRHRTRISAERQSGQPATIGDVTRAVQPRLAVEEPHVRQGEQPGVAPANEVPAGHEQRVERRVRSPLAIETRTFMPAPDGSPDTRRMVGIGEAVVFSANRPAEWTIAGQAPPGRGRRREIIHSLNERGTQTIEARAGEETAQVRIEVVEPRTRAIKLGESEVPREEGYGAAMFLSFRLTPLNISFASLEFKERDNEADEIWGYYERHPRWVRRHDAAEEWKTVDQQNNVLTTDLARFRIRPGDMDWPMVAGGFRWQIPNLYRLGGTERQFDTVTQAFQIAPNMDDSDGRADFRGRITVWKGGQEVSRVY